MAGCFFLHESFTTFISKQRWTRLTKLSECRQEILDLFDPKMARAHGRDVPNVGGNPGGRQAILSPFFRGSSWNEPCFLLQTHIPVNPKDDTFLSTYQPVRWNSQILLPPDLDRVPNCRRWLAFLPTSDTLPETNSKFAPENRPGKRPKRKRKSLPIIHGFRCNLAVSFRECRFGGASVALLR